MKEPEYYFGDIGIALSCTLFLEGALNRYEKYTESVDFDTVSIIKDWNKILINILKSPKYKRVLGIVGCELLKYINSCEDYVQYCIGSVYDVSAHALHYALRFNESVMFLKNKYKFDKNIKFVDLGCGLSPLIAIFQTKYDLKDVYCIDIIPEIYDLYTNALYQLCGKTPSFIDWNLTQKMATNGDLNTIVSVGCLPHMPTEMQKDYMKIINNKFPNFFVEVKYKKQIDVQNPDNAFTIMELNELGSDIKNINDIKSSAIHSNRIYMSKFMHANPMCRKFLNEQSRSLFLSR